MNTTQQALLKVGTIVKVFHGAFPLVDDDGKTPEIFTIIKRDAWKYVLEDSKGKAMNATHRGKKVLFSLKAVL